MAGQRRQAMGAVSPANPGPDDELDLVGRQRAKRSVRARAPIAQTVLAFVPSISPPDSRPIMPAIAARCSVDDFVIVTDWDAYVIVTDWLPLEQARQSFSEYLAARGLRQAELDLDRDVMVDVARGVEGGRYRYRLRRSIVTDPEPDGD